MVNEFLISLLAVIAIFDCWYIWMGYTNGRG